MSFQFVRSFIYCLTIFGIMFFYASVSHSETKSEQIPFRFQDDRNSLRGYEWNLDSNVLGLLLSLSRNTHTERKFDGNPENIVTILQGEYGILSRDEDASLVLSSFGAGPCINLIIYDEQKGTVALGHLDTYTIVGNSISEMLKGFGDSDKKFIKAKIFSAAPDNQLISKTLSTLRLHQIQVTEFGRQMNIAVNTNGELFDHNIVHLQATVNFSQRQEILNNLVEKSSARANELIQRGEATCGQCLLDRLTSEFQRMLVRVK